MSCARRSGTLWLAAARKGLLAALHAGGADAGCPAGDAEYRRQAGLVRWDRRGDRRDCGGGQESPAQPIPVQGKNFQEWLRVDYTTDTRTTQDTRSMAAG
jgi:hypothetical protein